MAILTHTEPRPRPALERDHQPYVPRDRRQHYLRLDLNEDLSGPLTHIAIPRGPDLAMYPTTHDLVRDLAAALALPADYIRVTAGADEAIYGVLNAYLGAGDGVLLPWPTFVEFGAVAHAVGADVLRAAYGPDLAFPLAAYRAALQRGPRVAVLVTPANPTGEWLAPDLVSDMAASAPSTLFLVDEAYAEYGHGSVLDLGPLPANTALIRTFSKAYGLAAARVGYLIAHPRIQHMVRQVLPSYSIAGPSLVLAQAGLAHRHRIAARTRAVRQGQRRIAAWGKAHEVGVHCTSANFVLLRLATNALASDLATALEAEGVLVADRTAVLPGALRVGVGAPRHVTAFLAALDRVWR
jgi:histidinol-phosphate aminotransferase